MVWICLSDISMWQRRNKTLLIRNDWTYFMTMLYIKSCSTYTTDCDARNQFLLQWLGENSLKYLQCLKRGWNLDFSMSLRGIRASRSGCSDHRSGHLWFRCSLPLVWCHGVGHLDSGAVAFFTVDHVICVWSVNCCSFSCGIACSSRKNATNSIHGPRWTVLKH